VELKFQIYVGKAISFHGTSMVQVSFRVCLKMGKGAVKPGDEVYF